MLIDKTYIFPARGERAAYIEMPGGRVEISSCGVPADAIRTSGRESLDAIGHAMAAGSITCSFASFFGTSPYELDSRGCAVRLYDGLGSPDFAYLTGYENDWREYPEYCDFLVPSSPVYQRKRYQWEIYSELLDAAIDHNCDSLQVADLGAGIGREAISLCARGCNVTLIDASQNALKSAWRHLSQTSGGLYDIALGDVSDLSFLPGDSYDIAVALEIFCYVTNPAKCLAEAIRIVRPGGLVLFSVEAFGGAFLSDPHYFVHQIINGHLTDGVLSAPGESFTRYFSRDDISMLCAGAGLAEVEITPCHFFADGAFDALVTEASLADPDRRKRYGMAERVLRTLTPEIPVPPRAYFVAATVKKTG